MKGYFWFARRFGLLTLIRYERARRSGVTIDYDKVLTADERAKLGEHLLNLPWERR